MIPEDEDEILRAFALIGFQSAYFDTALKSEYIIDRQEMGCGLVNWMIPIKKDWFIIRATFIANDAGYFRKLMLLYLDKEKHQLNRCHTYYIDQIDIDKKGGSYSNYKDHEIMATLIDHALHNDEETCIGCAGKHPLQTHYIQLLGEGEDFG